MSCEASGALVITIDGPTASGKGTVAQRIAQDLGFHYLDSGALYRLTALAARLAGRSWSDEVAVAEIARQLSVRFDTQGSVFLQDQEVTREIRSEEISSGASQVALHASVRTALLGRQRAFLRAPGLVADGRDMGSVVFPRASLKVFLTASPEARAIRRYKQLIEKGFSANFAALLRDLQERDARDAQRRFAPLIPAEGALVIDSTPLSVDQTVQAVLDAWRAVRPTAC
jgi:cytidylate kinase